MLREATFASDAAASSAAGPKIMAAKKKKPKISQGQLQHPARPRRGLANQGGTCGDRAQRRVWYACAAPPLRTSGDVAPLWGPDRGPPDVYGSAQSFFFCLELVQCLRSGNLLRGVWGPMAGRYRGLDKTMRLRFSRTRLFVAKSWPGVAITLNRSLKARDH